MRRRATRAGVAQERRAPRSNANRERSRLAFLVFAARAAAARIPPGTLLCLYGSEASARSPWPEPRRGRRERAGARTAIRMESKRQFGRSDGTPHTKIV